MQGHWVLTVGGIKRNLKEIFTLVFCVVYCTRSYCVSVRWYDYINSSFDMMMLWTCGPVNTSWTYDPDGRWKNIMDNVPAGSAWGEYRHTISTGGAGPMCMALYDYNNPTIRNVEDQNTLNAIIRVGLQEPFFNPAVIPVGLEEVKIVQDRAILATDIDTYTKNFIATSVMNGITDAQWAEHLRNCERLGTTRYAQSFQQLYDRSR